MALSKKCKNCKHKTWACPGWMCGNTRHPKFDPDGDNPVVVNINESCELFEESDNKIYVAIYNYFGPYQALLERYPGAELVNGDTLCFCNMRAEWISQQMEKDGCDYSYSYASPEDAWRKDDE